MLSMQATAFRSIRSSTSIEGIYKFSATLID
jgi:hypothetical protein